MRFILIIYEELKICVPEGLIFDMNASGLIESLYVGLYDRVVVGKFVETVPPVR